MEKEPETVMDAETFLNTDLDTLMALFPPSRSSPTPAPTTTPTPTPCSPYKENLYRYTNAAIEYYNANHQNDQFELVDPLYLRYFHGSGFNNGCHHLSFIARSKSSSKLKLFFTEFCHPVHVKTCTIVEPGNPLFEIGCLVCHPGGAIYHPIGKYEGTDWDSRVGYHRLRPREESAKRLLREAYTIKSNVQELNTEDVNELKKMINGYAWKALKQYNYKNRAFFEPLEPVSSVRFRCDVYPYEGNLWVHLIFEAKDNDSTCTDNSPVLFFAELGLDMGSGTTCVAIPTIDSGSSFSGYETSCAVCRDRCPMFHPEGEYVAGCKGGTFADLLYKGRGWAVKSELQQEDGDASHAARLEHYKQMEC